MSKRQWTTDHWAKPFNISDMDLIEIELVGIEIIKQLSTMDQPITNDSISIERCAHALTQLPTGRTIQDKLRHIRIHHNAVASESGQILHKTNECHYSKSIRMAVGNGRGEQIFIFFNWCTFNWDPWEERNMTSDAIVINSYASNSNESEWKLHEMLISSIHESNRILSSLA